MPQPKRRVLILFGGRSGEHEVSIVSATHVRQALDPERYDVALVGITREGEWRSLPVDVPLTEIDNLARAFERPRLHPGDRQLMPDGQQPVDVVIPVLHGPYGEDGTVQGLLELIGVPYVGCGVLASAVGMDKVTAKRVFRDVGIPVVPDQLVRADEFAQNPSAVVDRLERELTYPMFTKPSNLGSSVGVSKATSQAELEEALAHAAEYDHRVLVETAIDHAREIEVAVLGNDDVRVSVPGEIVPDREFYDYDAKYGNESTSEAKIPAPLDAALTRRVQQLAERAFRAIDGAGMARVDFLMNGRTNELYLNEINTIPGFTPISMYAKLWEASGLSYGQLLDELIRLALDRSKQKRALKTTRS